MVSEANLKWGGGRFIRNLDGKEKNRLKVFKKMDYDNGDVKLCKNVRGANPFPSTPSPIPDAYEIDSSKIPIFPAKSGSCLHFHVRTSQIKNMTHLNIDMGIPPLESTHKILVIFGQIWVRFPSFCAI